MSNYKIKKNIALFGGLVDSLVHLSWERRHALPRTIREDLPPAIYAREYCSVACDIGRQTGKSEYIRRNAGKGCLVVVGTVAEKKPFSGKDVPFDVSTAHDIMDNKEITIPAYKTIFVDEPARVFGIVPIAVFYKLLALPETEQTFVLLG